MGVGHLAMISRTALMPSSTGISMSMVMTSGRNCCALSTASRPFWAVSITVIRGS